MSIVTIDDLLWEKQFSWINDNPEDLPVWVIGDVHGCGEQYEYILSTIVSETPYCQIYQLGDLIDRGPDLLEVFELTYNFNVIPIIGNHELNFLQEYHGMKPCRSKARQETHDKFNALKPEDQEFIIKMMSTSYNRAIVHSNNRYWNLSHSLPSTLPFTDECVNAARMSMLSSEPVDKGLINYVHGHKHWEYVEIHQQIIDRASRNYVFNIDSGCVYGKHLTALELSSLQVLQVEGVEYAKETSYN